VTTNHKASTCIAALGRVADEVYVPTPDEPVRCDEAPGAAHHPALTTLARMGIPADRLVLDLALAQMAEHRRRGHPVALAEHFHYPHTARLLARYKQNLSAAVVGTRKVIDRRDGGEYSDLAVDPLEAAELGGTMVDDVVSELTGLPPGALLDTVAAKRCASAKLPTIIG
jgi:hypothetical protein